MEVSGDGVDVVTESVRLESCDDTLEGAIKALTN